MIEWPTTHTSFRGKKLYGHRVDGKPVTYYIVCPFARTADDPEHRPTQIDFMIGSPNVRALS